MSWIEPTPTEIAEAVRLEVCDFDTAVDLIAKYGELQALQAAREATDFAFDTFDKFLHKGVEA